MDFNRLLESIGQCRLDDESVAHFRKNWLPGVVKHLAEREAYRQRRSLHPDDCDEIAGHAFEIALQKGNPAKGGKAFRAWICQVIVYVTRNQLRRKHPIPTDFVTVESLLDAMASDDRGELTDEQIEKIEQAVHALPHNQQLAIILRYWGGYSSKEVARRLACSGNQVDQWLHKARKTLAKTLAPHFPEYGPPERASGGETANGSPADTPLLKEAPSAYGYIARPVPTRLLEEFEPDPALLRRFAYEDTLAEAACGKAGPACGVRRTGEALPTSPRSTRIQQSDEGTE
ncbi:RNA polymerase sigma factor [Paenibacillus sp. GYB003]|uniref:RNA polymerase sigma factor n=1 Tax=Paenibacillus sp. GYB003 TaxID=2994392 RepID=UPI002F961903